MSADPSVATTEPARPGNPDLTTLVRDHDWMATPLGSPEGWPQSLRTVVNILLTSRYAMWMAWGDHLTMLYNDAYSPTLGMKHPWALGRPASEVWTEIWPDIGPRIQAVLSTGEATWDEALMLFLHRSGFPEETYHTFSYSPLTDDSGRISGMLCVVTEETERIISERRMATLRDLAADLASSSKEMDVLAAVRRQLGANPKDLPFTLTYLFDDRGQARLACSTGIERGHPAAPELIEAADAGPWPAYEMFRYPVSRLVEGPVQSGRGLPMGAWDRPPGQAAVVPVKQQGHERPAGFLVAALNPYRRYDAGYAGFVDLVAGQVAAGIANARAYEAERRRAEALAELDHAKTQFFSNISHEFRTPLTLMLGPIEDLVARADAEDRETLNLVHRNGLRLLRLVNSLLDFSRIEAGRVKAVYVPTDIASYTADLAATFRSATERAGLRLQVECSPLPEPVFVDHEMWEKVVLNLVSNAFKFTFEGGITVRLNAVGDNAELSVADTGTGIAASELPHLFERFHRVDGARGRTFEGSGIGLALVQELVGLHGGSIRVTSQVGRGTTFTVSVPLGKEHLPADRIGTPRDMVTSNALRAEAFVEEALRWLPEKVQTGERNDRVAGGIVRDAEVTPQEKPDQVEGTVLLADDNADMRGYVRHLLSSRYRVIPAVNGEEALRLAVAESPDLILSDIMMPVLDGYGLIRALRSHPGLRTVPVILLSARAGEESRSEGMDAGADDYLVKPFSARELLARVGAHLRLARARKEAEQQASDILESITDGFAALDREWRFTYANNEAERLVGMDRNQMLGRAVWELFPAAVGTRFHRELLKAAKDRVPTEFDTLYAPWNRWFHCRAYPSAVDGLSLFFEDVTLRKQVEEDLRASEARFRAVVNAVTSLVSTHDAEGRVVEEQPAWSRFTGQAYEAYRGFGWTRAVHPEDAGPTLEAWRRAIAEKRLFSFEHRLRRHDGVWRTFSVRATPVLDGSGELRALIGAHTDVTEERQLVQALRDSEARFRIMADSAPVQIWISDHGQHCTWVNRLWLEFAGRPMERELGRGWTERIHPEDGDACLGVYEAACARGEPFETEFRIARRDGEYRWLLFHGTPLPDGAGGFAGYVGSAIDITERKRHAEALQQANEELRRVNRELEEFAFVSSHDLQEPLRMINIFTHLLINKSRTDEPDIREYAGFIRHGVLRMEELIRDLLSYSRVVHTDGEPAGKADLAESFEKAIEMLKAGIAETEADITAGPLPVVRGDAVQLAHVFQNLFSNSLKYRRREVRTEIRVSAARDNGDWVISVRDNGIGFQPQYAERIFGLFKRLHKDEYPGTGLGLAICKRIVERYGGRMWAEGRPGDGATLHFRLRDGEES